MEREKEVRSIQCLMAENLNGVGLLAIMFQFNVALNAAVITDGTVGSVETLTGPHYQVEQSLGRTVGSNLFHSFQQFDLSHSESATFTGSDSIQNVISRVTGGQLSSIDGTLNSEIGQANFYFINPAGVVLGPNAQVNVPGNFHVSTASELRLVDGAVFNALHPESSTLSMAPPESFGFLNDHSAAIRIEGSQLTFESNSSVFFVGDVIEINDSSIINPDGQVYLNAPSNFQMQNSLISTDGNLLGLIAIDTGNANVESSLITANTTGNQSIRENTGIIIKTRSLRLNNTEIYSVTEGASDAGSIFLSASDDMQIARSGIYSVAGEESAGNAGSITLIAGDALLISKGGSVGSSTLSSGNGSDVFIQADSLTIDGKDSNATGIHNLTLGSGNLGLITIDIENDITLANHAQIISKSDRISSGGGGAINIQAENLRMQNQVLISTESTNPSAANPINITAEQSLYLDHSMIATSATLANAGDISLASNVLIMDGGIIQANTLGAGTQAGNINIDAKAIIAHQGQLTVSDRSVQAFLPGGDLNVIQSAGPDGVSGNLNISRAELNINEAWMTESTMKWLDMRFLIETPCLNPGIRDSKLSREGSGGMPELPSDVRSVPLNPARMRHILAIEVEGDFSKQALMELSNTQLLFKECGRSMEAI